MREILGVLIMVLIVSGDDVTDKDGVEYDSVLLPCPCSERDLDEEFQWQMEEPNMTLVFRYNRPNSNFYGRYEGRAKIFVAENSSDCSVLLTNITAGDQGKYKCSFLRQGQYKRFFVNLNVSASYTVCQKRPDDLNGNTSVKVFQCDVQGGYREAAIQWDLDGRPLANSQKTHINHTYHQDALTGFHHFKSKLITTLNMTSEPRCHVKAKGISTVVSHNCRPETEPHTSVQSEHVRSYLKIIPVVLVLGCSLVLWRRSHRLHRR